jgi:hypothetical protein
MVTIHLQLNDYAGLCLCPFCGSSCNLGSAPWPLNAERCGHL